MKQFKRLRIAVTFGLLAICMFCLSACTTTRAQVAQKSTVVLDTDAGLDDAVAILLAKYLNVSPTYYVCTEGSTTADSVVRNVSVLSRYLGLSAKTIKGRETHPDTPADYFGKDGLANLSAQMMSDYGMTGEDVKANMMLADFKQELLQYDHITYIVIGPLITFIDLIQDEEVKSRIDKVYIMGGGINVFNTDGESEFNFHENPEAVQKVLSSGLDITLITLDLTTAYAPVYQDQIEVLASTGRYPEYIAMLKFVYELDTADGKADATALHDTMPVLYYAYPEKFSVKDVKIICDKNGHIEINEDGYPIHLLEKGDPALLFDCLKKSFGVD